MNVIPCSVKFFKDNVSSEGSAHQEESVNRGKTVHDRLKGKTLRTLEISGSRKEVSCVGNNEEERVTKDNPGHAQKPGRINGKIGTDQIDIKEKTLTSFHSCCLVVHFLTSWKARWSCL